MRATVAGPIALLYVIMAMGFNVLLVLAVLHFIIKWW